MNRPTRMASAHATRSHTTAATATRRSSSEPLDGAAEPHDLGGNRGVLYGRHCKALTSRASRCARQAGAYELAAGTRSLLHTPGPVPVASGDPPAQPQDRSPAPVDRRHAPTRRDRPGGDEAQRRAAQGQRAGPGGSSPLNSILLANVTMSLAMRRN